MNNLEEKKRHQFIFNKVLELTDDGFIVVDYDGVITEINEKYSTFLNTTPKDAIGKNIVEFIPNTKMLDIMKNRYTEEGVVHRYLTGFSKEDKVIVSRSFVENEDNEVIAGVAQVKFKVSSLDVTKKLLEEYTTLNYYKEQYQSLKDNIYGFDKLLGKDQVFEELKHRGSQISRTNFPVLLTGETGTGKEVFANAIHNSSNQSDFPMISINCAAIPDDLLESELFGYEEGAFTGAKKGGKEGKFILANKGTLFLDEIGDLPLPMQAKLLRVLEEKKVDPIGGTTSIPIEFRLITATSKNLIEMVKEGTFREDLFYRINVVNLEMIPLRKRRDDIIILSNYFIENLNHEYRREKYFSQEVLVSLYSYNWPGNVRELENVIKSAYAVSDGEELRLQDLPARLVSNRSNEQVKNWNLSYRESIEKYEQDLLIMYLRENNGNVSRAAKQANIHRSLFYKKIKKHNIDIRKYSVKKRGHKTQRNPVK